MAATFLEKPLEFVVLAALPALFLAATATIRALLGLGWQKYGADTARIGLITLFPCMVVSFVTVPGGADAIRILAALLLFLAHYAGYWGLVRVSFLKTGWLAEKKEWVEAVGGAAIFYSAAQFAIGYLRSGSP